MNSNAQILEPRPDERARFLRLLERRVPPGPTYLELVQEIWFRGFEVFLVGGTVRDVLADQETQDVDLVTTMPLSLAKPLLASMYRTKPSIEESRGFVRLGGTPASGDPFIDLKSFVFAEPGTPNAIFAGDFATDVSHRDFTCNAVYYDPNNDALLDPCGKGIADASSRTLEVVCDHVGRPPFYLAQIAIRFFKFVARGYVYSDEAKATIDTVFLPALAAMRNSQIVRYTRTQILSKTPVGQRATSLQQFEASIRAFGATNVWVDVFEPVVADIIEERE